MPEKTNFFCNDTDQVSLVERLDKLDIFLKNYCPTHFSNINNLLDQFVNGKNLSDVITDAYIYNIYLGYNIKDGMLLYEEGSKREFLKAQGLFSRFINMEVINEFSFFMGNNRWIYVNINCFLSKTPIVSSDITKYTDHIKLSLMNLNDLIFIFGYSNVIKNRENDSEYFSCFEYLLCLEEHVDTQTVIDKIKTELNLFRDKYEFSQDLIVKELKNKDELKCFFTGDYWFDCYPGENYIFCSQPGYFLSIYKFSHSVLEYYLLFSYIKKLEGTYYIKEDSCFFLMYKLAYCVELGKDVDNYILGERAAQIFACQRNGIEKNFKLQNYLYRLLQDTFLNEFAHVVVPDVYAINYEKDRDSILSLEEYTHFIDNVEKIDDIKLKDIKLKILSKQLTDSCYIVLFIINSEKLNKKIENIFLGDYKC